MTISELFAEYEKDMAAGKRWRKSTRWANEAMMRNMVEILGDRPVADVDKSIGRKFKAGLQKFPINRSKHPDYRDKTFDEIYALPKVKTVSVVTVNNRLARAKGMFRWGLDNGYIPYTATEGSSHIAAGRVRPISIGFVLIVKIK